MKVGYQCYHESQYLHSRLILYGLLRRLNQPYVQKDVVTSLNKLLGLIFTNFLTYIYLSQNN